MIEISICIGFIFSIIFFFWENNFQNIDRLPSYQIVKKGNLYCVEQLFIIRNFWIFIRYQYVFVGGFQYENEALEYVVKMESEYSQKQEKILLYKTPTK